MYVLVRRASVVFARERRFACLLAYALVSALLEQRLRRRRKKVRKIKSNGAFLVVPGTLILIHPSNRFILFFAARFKQIA